MTTNEYKQKLIAYFRDGKPTEAAWNSMASIVSDWTENATDDSGDKLHTEVFGSPWTCVECGQHDNWFDECWSCDTKRLGE